jgi:hypothetical protein
VAWTTFSRRTPVVDQATYSLWCARRARRYEARRWRAQQIEMLKALQKLYGCVPMVVVRAMQRGKKR